MTAQEEFAHHVIDPVGLALEVGLPLLGVALVRGRPRQGRRMRAAAPARPQRLL